MGQELLKYISLHMAGDNKHTNHSGGPFGFVGRLTVGNTLSTPSLEK